ncbi:MAG: MMPL family transporter [SAR324 cluster bacterium]|nr:MMPL family transporter [SAR324 cluster bacterium]
MNLSLIHWMRVLIRRWAYGVIKYRKWIIGLTVLSQIILLVPISKLSFDNSAEIWFLPDDPAMYHYERSNYLFGDHQSFVIGIEARQQDIDIINGDTLLIIHEITQFLDQQDYVSRVNSLSNYQYHVYERGKLTSHPLFEDPSTWKGTPKQIDQIVKIMQKETLIHGTLITSDFRNTIISAKVIYQKGSFNHHIQLLRDVREFLKNQNYEERGYSFHFTGTSAIYGQIQENNETDRRIVQPMMVILLVLLLYFVFRSWLSVFCAVSVVVFSVAVTYGFTSIMGWKLNILNTPGLSVLIIAAGIGDAIHFLTEFYAFRNIGYSQEYAAITTQRQLFTPCFYTSMTTAIGFWALTFTELIPVKEYGVMASVGVFSAFLFSFTFLPSVLSFTNENHSFVTPHYPKFLITGIGNFLIGTTSRYGRWIVIIALAFTFGAGWICLSLKADSGIKSYFRANSKITQDLEYFDQHYQNTGGMMVILKVSNIMMNQIPALLKKLVLIEDAIEKNQDSGNVRSIADYVRHINKIVHGNNPNYYTIPDSQQTLDHYLYLYQASESTEALKDLISSDGNYIKLEIPQKYISSLTTRKNMIEVEELISKELPEFEFFITGDAVLDSKKDTYVIRGLSRSFLISLATILLCFFLMLRSVKYGLISMIPCIMPIVVAGALMVQLDIYLNFNTMIIASLTFGVAVDDTMHMMKRYSRLRKSGLPRRQSVEKAFTSAGQAVILTSVILLLGFGINVLSTFLPAVHFAILGGTIIVLACLADLFVLPSLLLFWEKPTD